MECVGATDGLGCDRVGARLVTQPEKVGPLTAIACRHSTGKLEEPR